MLDKIIRFSLKNRLTILVITGALLIWGCLSLIDTDIDIFPDLNAPTVTIMTEAPGMTPEEVERTITYPIETALNGAADVRRVRSASSTGFSVVWVEFDWNADPNIARQTVSEKIANLAGQMPPSASTPVLGPQSSILGEIMIIGLRSTGATTATELRTIADRTLSPRILSLGGVSQVSVIGGDVAEYQIRLKPDRMKYFGITLQEVRDASESLNQNGSGGVIYDYGNEYLIKAEVHSNNPEDIAKSIVRSNAEGETVTIGDIADVVIGAQSPKLGTASVKTQNAVLVTVTKQRGASTEKITENIDRMLGELKATMPSDIQIDTDIFRQNDFISGSVNNLKESLLEGSIFVMIVLFIFLMNFRTAIISIVAIPLSIIVTLLILSLSGMTINTMVLGGIAIAIGSLVDDAIVDVENVYKRLRQNFSLPKDEQLPIRTIVFEASKEVRLPILNSTLIIVASFLPLFFLSGMEGRLLIPLGLAFIIALAASTIVALTVTPVLCSYLLAGEKQSSSTTKEPWLSRKLNQLYCKSLDSALGNRKKILIITGITVAGAIACFFTLGRGFLPSFNEGSLTINVATLPGISLEESDRIGREAEKIILSIPEIKTTARKTGRAELDEHSLEINMSEIEAPYTLSGQSREEMVADLRHKLSHLPGTNIEIGQPISHRIDAMLSGTEAQVAIKVFGEDLDALRRIARDIKDHISAVDGIVDVNMEQQIERPQIDIRPRRELLAKYGITNRDFTSAIETMTAGITVSQVFTEGVPYDIVLKIDPNECDGIADLTNLMIDSNIGKIPLSYVAEIVSSSGPNTIKRENVKRRMVVSANVEGTDLRNAVNSIKEVINKQVTIPENYYIEYAGQFENEAKASRTLVIASAGAILLILLLLMHEYHSIPQALVILTNMPLAIVGGVLMLFITGRELNIPAIIGFISLMGIATRGGMLLVSRYNSLKETGVPLRQRLLKGSSDRLNPIIMTALTSALALIPLAVRGTEPGNEIQSPMALVILGGLITSTILNLYIVPILYSYIKKSKKQ
jgi:Cu(I)/Ag(I) efflux system membrane protein CusA/SilA